MKSKRIRFSAAVAIVASATLVLAQSDVTKAITVARHADVTFSDADARRKLGPATTLLRTRDRNTDVACGVILQLSGSVGTFGTAGDGDDVITTQAELTRVMAVNAHRIKVVTSIQGSRANNVCGSAGSVLGCATTPGTTIVMALRAAPDVWAHEFGHNQGLRHRDTSNKNIMHST
ncbi:MAG TPA: zinc-dependent metalloprotease family protein, partial [Thermoanaerobaculia bacterium]|nr:zinc-dependent metalloprotease family protein [Thermoanaerobaculia bacterium]